MVRSRLGLIMALVLAPALPSCGQSGMPALYPVHGKVIYKGQPAAGATVMFQREDAPTPNTVAGLCIGQVDTDGNFSLETEDLGQGAPAGKYKVLIQWRVKGDDSANLVASTKKVGRNKIVPDKPDGVPDRLQGRYMTSEKSRIKVEIKPEENTLEPFDVSS